MEYEISGEEKLFDDSTNPSLLHADWHPPAPRRSARHQADPVDKRRTQKAEMIPEEDPQLG